MKRRLTVLASLTLFVGLVAAAADALIVTDQELVEAIVDGMEGELSAARIDDALVHIRTGEVPVTVRAMGSSHRYDGDDAKLAADTQRRLSAWLGSEVEILQRHVEVDGQSARVNARMRLPQGAVNVSAEFEKHGTQWLLRRASIS